MTLGFAAGLLLDLAPPADHIAGRWALALLVVGLRRGSPRHPGLGHRAHRALVGPVATVAACSFVGTSVFALTGLVLRDPLVEVPDAARHRPGRARLGRSARALVVPLVLALDERLDPENRLVA